VPSKWIAQAIVTITAIYNLTLRGCAALFLALEETRPDHSYNFFYFLMTVHLYTIPNDELAF
jgi:hypothetical protein